MQLFQIINSRNEDFVTTVINLLDQKLASEDVINAYKNQDLDWSTVNILFVYLSAAVETQLKKHNTKGGKGRSPSIKRKMKKSGTVAFQESPESSQLRRDA